jgi:hypothetical protein
MIRQPKNVDFYTTRRHLSEEDFAKISEWIKMQKNKNDKLVARKKSQVQSANKTRALQTEK